MVTENFYTKRAKWIFAGGVAGGIVDGNPTLPANMLTKREHFAALAMNGLLAGGFNDNPESDTFELCRHAVATADIVLDILENGDDPFLYGEAAD